MATIKENLNVLIRKLCSCLHQERPECVGPSHRGRHPWGGEDDSTCLLSLLHSSCWSNSAILRDGRPPLQDETQCGLRVEPRLLSVRAPQLVLDWLHQADQTQWVEARPRWPSNCVSCQGLPPAQDVTTTDWEPAHSCCQYTTNTSPPNPPPTPPPTSGPAQAKLTTKIPLHIFWSRGSPCMALRIRGYPSLNLEVNFHVFFQKIRGSSRSYFILLKYSFPFSEIQDKFHSLCSVQESPWHRSLINIWTSGIKFLKF